MRSHKLAIGAVLSLLGLALLTATYFREGCIGAIWTTSGQPRIGGRSLTLWSMSGWNSLSLTTRTGWWILLAPGTPQCGPFYASGEWRAPRRDVVGNTFWSIHWQSSASADSLSIVTTRDLAFPSWMLMLPCTIAPAWWLRRQRRQRFHHQPGHCPTCGYDLRATPQGGADLLPRCPECGTAPTAAEPR